MLEGEVDDEGVSPSMTVSHSRASHSQKDPGSGRPVDPLLFPNLTCAGDRIADTMRPFTGRLTTCMKER